MALIKFGRPSIELPMLMICHGAWSFSSEGHCTG